MLTQSNLRQFTGTEGYLRWQPLLFPRMVLSEGAKYVAERGGEGNNSAWWLMDAIASHQPKCLKIEQLREIQFWTLKKNADGSALLTCQIDSGVKPTITQKIPYTDFSLDEIKLWVGPLNERLYVIYLPSES